ncbi:hypothetical protein B0H13DRAFT_2562142, partial [Mycena leptocephala]
NRPKRAPGKAAPPRKRTTPVKKPKKATKPASKPRGKPRKRKNRTEKKRKELKAARAEMCRSSNAGRLVTVGSHGSETGDQLFKLAETHVLHCGSKHEHGGKATRDDWICLCIYEKKRRKEFMQYGISVGAEMGRTVSVEYCLGSKAGWAWRWRQGAPISRELRKPQYAPGIQRLEGLETHGGKSCRVLLVELKSNSSRVESLNSLGEFRVSRARIPGVSSVGRRGYQSSRSKEYAELGLSRTADSE